MMYINRKGVDLQGNTISSNSNRKDLHPNPLGISISLMYILRIYVHRYLCTYTAVHGYTDMYNKYNFIVSRVMRKL